VVELVADNGLIELSGYSPESSLRELTEAVEAIRITKGLETERCYGCGGCCREPIPVLGYDIMNLAAVMETTGEDFVEKYLDLPEPPNVGAKRKATEELIRQHGFDPLEAALIYEFNHAEPVTFRRDETGACLFCRRELCTIYEHRPYICGLYVCNMGDALSVLYEKIVSQGVWHTYASLGWITEEEIAHNPFLKAKAEGKDPFGKILLRDFEFDLERALEAAFFYF
jgi:Fe-S-cluster containining protein